MPASCWAGSMPRTPSPTASGSTARPLCVPWPHSAPQRVGSPCTVPPASWRSRRRWWRRGRNASAPRAGARPARRDVASHIHTRHPVGRRRWRPAPGDRDLRWGRGAAGPAPLFPGAPPHAPAPAAPPHHRARPRPRQRRRLGARRARPGRDDRRSGDPRGVRCHGTARAAVARHRAPLRRRARGAAMTLDAVGLGVMGHAVASLAEEMWLLLIHSAVSANIRERRDCSAALFDRDGEMIAQAAHIPVHLGALAQAVVAVRALEPEPGEVFVLNDPYAGGSHLPDLTLVGAIAVEQALGGYSVVRAHHSAAAAAPPAAIPPPH